jgi:hypothetical protein
MRSPKHNAEMRIPMTLACLAILPSLCFATAPQSTLHKQPSPHTKPRAAAATAGNFQKPEKDQLCEEVFINLSVDDARRQIATQILNWPKYCNVLEQQAANVKALGENILKARAESQALAAERLLQDCPDWTVKRHFNTEKIKELGAHGREELREQSLPNIRPTNCENRFELWKAEQLAIDTAVKPDVRSAIHDLAACVASRTHYAVEIDLDQLFLQDWFRESATKGLIFVLECPAYKDRFMQMIEAKAAKSPAQ